MVLRRRFVVEVSGIYPVGVTVVVRKSVLKVGVSGEQGGHEDRRHL